MTDYKSKYLKYKKKYLKLKGGARPDCNPITDSLEQVEDMPVFNRPGTSEYNNERLRTIEYRLNDIEKLLKNIMPLYNKVEILESKRIPKLEEYVGYLQSKQPVIFSHFKTLKDEIVDIRQFLNMAV